MRALTRLFQDFRPQGVVLGGNGGGSNIPLTDLGPHIGDYLRQPGGQRLGLADGTYDGQNIDLAGSRHTRDTAKAYNGWLILQAETPGGVTIDLSDPGPGVSPTGYRGGWRMKFPGLTNGFTKLPLRVLLVGCHVIDGMNDWEWLDYIRTWHCTFSNDVYEWNDQYTAAYHAAHGTDPVNHGNWDSTLNMNNWTATAFRTGNLDHFEHYFTDFVDIGDDALFASLGDFWYFQGCRWDNISHHEINYLNPAEGHGLMHSDCIQTTGGTNPAVRNCSFNGHLQFQNNGGSIVLDFDNWWQYGSGTVGFSFDESFSNSHISGDMRRGKWFANGQSNATTDFPTTDAPSYHGAFDRLWNDPNTPSNLRWYNDLGTQIPLDSFENFNHSFPDGIDQAGGPVGLLHPDYTSYPHAPWPHSTAVFDHPFNPAVIDRAVAGHGAADWEGFFDTVGWP